MSSPHGPLAHLPEELLAQIMEDPIMEAEDYLAMVHTCKPIRNKLKTSQRFRLRSLQEYSKWRYPAKLTQRHGRNNPWLDTKSKVAKAHSTLERWRLKEGLSSDDWFCQACCKYKSQDEFIQACFGEIWPYYPAGRRILRRNADEPRFRTCKACLLRFKGNTAFYKGNQTFIFHGKRCFLCSRCEKPIPEKLERGRTASQLKSYAQRRVCLNCKPIYGL